VANKIILGIDPGYARVGWAIVEKVQNKPGINLIKYACLETTAAEKMEDRLNFVYDEITKICLAEKPEVCCIEKLFFARNVSTAMLVSEAFGVILVALQKQGVGIFPYTPMQIKKVVTGSGRGTKEQVHASVNEYFKTTKAIKLDDTVDAIAAALCYAKLFGLA
jgi:crossover junction endodeoxyribonuclease RuvC